MTLNNIKVFEKYKKSSPQFSVKILFLKDHKYFLLDNYILDKLFGLKLIF